MQRNHLAAETSPYLQQHADNPVDWYPWGEEALARARRENKPILLSVGYSACHWCHVMAHESFEDPETAEVMNRLFVNIKVDREERPDLDKIYQTAQQLHHAARGRLAADHVPDARGSAAVFRRHLFPARCRATACPAFKDLLRARGRVLSRPSRGDPRAERAGSPPPSTRARWLANGAPRRTAPRSTIPRCSSRAPRSSVPSTARFGGFGAAPKFPHPAEHRALPARCEPRVAVAWPRSR